MNLPRTLFSSACLLAASLPSAEAGDLLAQLSGPPEQLVALADDAAPAPPADEAPPEMAGCGVSNGNCGAASAGCGAGCGSWLDSVGDGGCLLTGIFDTVGGALSPLGTDLKSDRAFDGFIEPVTNPVFFEDPRSRTRVRFLFINQLIPEGSILQGGDLQVYGLEAAFALTDRLSIIAQKDGYIELQSDLLPKSEGTADIATGLKYVLIRDVENQFIVSTGFQFEWSNGSSDVFQGNGDGVWNVFLSGGKEICCDTHFVAAIGGHFPSDPAAESTSLYYSLHLDHAITDNFYALWEMNGLQYTRSGRAPGFAAFDEEGGDLINLGSGNVAGNHILTTAFGMTYKFNPNWETAAAYEFPLTKRNDFLDERLTFTLSYVY